MFFKTLDEKQKFDLKKSEWNLEKIGWHSDLHGKMNLNIGGCHHVHSTGFPGAPALMRRDFSQFHPQKFPSCPLVGREHTLFCILCRSSQNSLAHPLCTLGRCLFGHPTLLNGSGLESLLKGIPALNLVATLIYVVLDNRVLSLAVRSPALGEIISGAEIELVSFVLYHVSSLLSFSILRAQSCHILAMWIGLMPLTSSCQTFSNFSTPP